MLEVYRTAANKRYYTEEQYLWYIAQSSDEGKKINERMLLMQEFLRMVRKTI